MLSDLMKVVNHFAKERSDGHFTLMSFSSGWKAMFGTPDLDSGNGRKDIWNLPTFKTPEEAIINALNTFLTGGE